MTMTREHDRNTRRDEDGTALVGVLLMLMLMSALAAALGVSGRTETLVARNHQTAAQARAAAEAGLSHAADAVIAYLAGQADPSLALDDLLNGPDDASGLPATDSDNGSLEFVAGWDIAKGTTRTITAGLTATYEAWMMDEDDPDRGVAAAQIAAIGEDGNPYVDANDRVVIRVIGYAANSTSVTLEAMIEPIDFPAIVTGGDLTISGSATITGTDADGNPTGSVHSNGSLTITGGSAYINGNASASEEFYCSQNPCTQVAGTETEHAPEIDIPSVRAADHRHKADFILTASGTMTNQAGTVLCSASPCNDWQFSSGQWIISGNTATNGTYYVEGGARISGNPGSNKSPVSITVIAEGSIEISGNPDLMPDYPELMFVTDGDLKLNGNYEQPLTAQGQMLVREQLMISGNPTIAGQIIVENVPSVDNLVTDNTISGNPTISYSGGLSGGGFTVSSWREVR